MDDTTVAPLAEYLAQPPEYLARRDRRGRQIPAHPRPGGSSRRTPRSRSARSPA